MVEWSLPSRFLLILPLTKSRKVAAVDRVRLFPAVRRADVQSARSFGDDGEKVGREREDRVLNVALLVLRPKARMR
jgi:hypothetical protein